VSSGPAHGGLETYAIFRVRRVRALAADTRVSGLYTVSLCVWGGIGKAEMQPAEIAGLVISVAFAGLAIGVAVTLLIVVRKDRNAELHIRRTDACGQWLAARTILTRASISFVAAFRAMAAESEDSKYYGLRQDEAQRVRSDWCEAMREVDRCEAALVAWSLDPNIRSKLDRFERVSADALRSAVDGSEVELAEFKKRLHHLDNRAVEFVRASAGDARREPSWPAQQVLRGVRFASTIVDNWGK